MSVVSGHKRSLSGYTNSTQQRMNNNLNPSSSNSLNKSSIQNNKSKITPVPDYNKKFVSNNQLVNSSSSKKAPNQLIKPKSPQIFKKITNKPMTNSTVLSSKTKKIEVNMDDNQTSFLKKANVNPVRTAQPQNKYGQSNNINRLKKFSEMILNEKKDEDLKNKSFNFTPNDNKDNSYVASKTKLSKRLTVTGNDASIDLSINKPGKEFLNRSVDIPSNVNKTST